MPSLSRYEALLAVTRYTQHVTTQQHIFVSETVFVVISSVAADQIMFPAVADFRGIVPTQSGSMHFYKPIGGGFPYHPTQDFPDFPSIYSH